MRDETKNVEGTVSFLFLGFPVEVWVSVGEALSFFCTVSFMYFESNKLFSEND